ncbi:hypothetical protein UF78_10235 [Stutzerimonas stutzeri]|uniref:Uncharacterized protein n=1 Tax=Stutzerimonas stutzeri TaxID=316 RepID=A0A0D9AMZ4_STUST|nr:hypothetical protein UF78_10235 [Stutzerimonas stutzeri]
MVMLAVEIKANILAGFRVGDLRLVPFRSHLQLFHFVPIAFAIGNRRIETEGHVTIAKLFGDKRGACLHQADGCVWVARIVRMMLANP